MAFKKGWQINNENKNQYVVSFVQMTLIYWNPAPSPNILIQDF
jgi:hypothetical protein